MKGSPYELMCEILEPDGYDDSSTSGWGKSDEKDEWGKKDFSKHQVQIPLPLSLSRSLCV